MPGNDDDEDHQEKLKAALWYNIGKAVDNESIALDVNVTPQFIGALTEMVFSQVESVAKDLESFANHASRSTINTDDVLLLARRNEGLEQLLKDFVESEKDEREQEKGADAKKKGKGKAAAGKSRPKK